MKSDRDIKLVATDIDGVWTDGGMYYSSDGDCLRKFNTRDSAGVLLLKAVGIPCVGLSGEDSDITRRRLEKLGLDTRYVGVSNKLSTAERIASDRGMTLSNIAYVGDDINDVALLANAGYSACPADAPFPVFEVAGKRLSARGGEGAFREFVEWLLRERQELVHALSQVTGVDVAELSKHAVRSSENI